MPFTIRRPIQIELDREPQQREERRQRSRLAEEMAKFREAAEKALTRENRQALAAQRLAELGPAPVATATPRPAPGPVPREAPRPVATPAPPLPEEPGRGFLGELGQAGGGILRAAGRAERATGSALLGALRLGTEQAGIGVIGGPPAISQPQPGRATQLVQERGLGPGIMQVGRETTGPFAAEQKFIAQRTRPLIRDALVKVGVPESVAAPIALIGSQLALPTTFFPFVGQGSRARRVARAITVGAALSVEQENAFIQEFEERDPELWELLTAGAAGGGGAGIIESGAIGAAFRRFRGGGAAAEDATAPAAAEAVQAAPEVGPAAGGRPAVSAAPEAAPVRAAAVEARPLSETFRPPAAEVLEDISEGTQRMVMIERDGIQMTLHTGGLTNQLFVDVALAPGTQPSIRNMSTLRRLLNETAELNPEARVEAIFENPRLRDVAVRMGAPVEGGRYIISGVERIGLPAAPAKSFVRGQGLLDERQFARQQAKWMLDDIDQHGIPRDFTVSQERMLRDNGIAYLNRRPADVVADLRKTVQVAPEVAAPEPSLVQRFDVPAEAITAETRIPPGVSRTSPLRGQQLAELPAGQLELPFPRTRNAQEIASLAAERRTNLRAIREGAEAGTHTADDVVAAEADLSAARAADTTARAADLEDLTKKSFDELIDAARRACSG